jgi:hypothetical protein
MTDTHLSFLRLVAQQRCRALEEHERDTPPTDATMIKRRKQLTRVAKRATRQVVNAEARRRRLKTRRP